MKKIYMYIGANPMGKRQIRIYNNNPLVKMIRNSSETELLILMATVNVPTIKGKLGYSFTAQDGVFLFNSRAIHSGLLANPGGYYTPPFSGMALLDTAIVNFDTAINDVRDGVRGAEGAKITTKKQLMKMLRKALIYINLLSMDDQTNAVEIITGAKMLVNKPIRVDKQNFSVKQGPGTGLIALSAKAIRVDRKYYKASYEWQFSIDNGRTWENLPVTTKAKTMAVGMLPGIATLFRMRSESTKTALSAWCTPIEIIPM